MPDALRNGVMVNDIELVWLGTLNGGFGLGDIRFILTQIMSNGLPKALEVVLYRT